MRKRSAPQRPIRAAAQAAIEKAIEAENSTPEGTQVSIIRQKVLPKDALKAQQIWNGSYTISDLKDSFHSIGERNHICPFCNAKKFKKEISSSCCLKGKVALVPFPKPPETIYKLWKDNSTEANLFRENSRSFNNSLCLSSIKVKERSFSRGYKPAVIFEGRVMNIVGPMIASVGETPVFAQLYVHDPSLEITQRFRNMSIPASTSSAQKRILCTILSKLQTVMKEVNPYIKDFKQVCEISDEELEQGKIILSAKKKPSVEHSRRYNLQTNLSEISILRNSEPHDLVLRKRGGKLKIIQDLNPHRQPLHFTLLFPYGTHGWDQTTMHTDGKRRVTAREFYSYHIRERDTENDYIFNAGRLFQEFLCMAYALVEDQNLNYQRTHQKELRTDKYKSVKEAVELRRQIMVPTNRVYPDDNNLPPIGRTILTSSFVGGPRWFASQYQDAMAILAEYRKPDFFITMTCNPKWPEITACLVLDQIPQDRPDVVSQVFKLKKDQLIQDLTQTHVLGRAVAYLAVVEFQKRGLPHVHILLILAQEDRPITGDDVDNIICAELPPDPNTTKNPAIKDQRRRLESIVKTNMIHGPCDERCMENNKCNKNYPKEFSSKTTIEENLTYPKYRRRSPIKGGRTIMVRNRVIDNRDVIPYSPFLSLRYNCHINVEICNSARAAKYLYKYVCKGSDRAMVSTEIEGQAIDEVNEYQDLRSIGSMEATWGLFCYSIAQKFPAVIGRIAN